MELNLPNYLVRLADDLDRAQRHGSDTDSPEGARTILMSDTMAREIAASLRVAADAMCADVDA